MSRLASLTALGFCCVFALILLALNAAGG